MTIDNSESFKYKAALSGKTTSAIASTNSSVKDAKIVVPLKYLSNFWRSLEMPLINCKVYLELNWIEECILSSARNTPQFEITDRKLYVSIVTLSTKDSAILTKQLNRRFKRSFYMNSYETRPAKVIEQVKNIDGLLANYLQTTKRLFVFADAIAAPVDDNPTDRTAGIKVNKK